MANLQEEMTKDYPYEQQVYFNEEGNRLTVKLFLMDDMEGFLKEYFEREWDKYHDRVESGELEAPPDTRVVIKERTHLNKTYQIIAEPDDCEGLGYKDGYVGIRYIDGDRVFHGQEEYFGTGMGWDKVKELEIKGNKFLFRQE